MHLWIATHKRELLFWNIFAFIWRLNRSYIWKDVWWYRTWRWREVGDSSQSFSSDTLQVISLISLSWHHQVQTHATYHLQSDPSWISLQANHLNSSNLESVASGSLCVPHENRMEIESNYYNKVLRSRSLRERRAKFPMSIILCMLGGFAETSSLPVTQNACGWPSTGGQVGLLFWHRSIKTFPGCSPWSVSYEDECLFNFTTNLSDFNQHFSLTK